jgi:phospholipase C
MKAFALFTITGFIVAGLFSCSPNNGRKVSNEKANDETKAAAEKIKQLKSKVKHIIIIYQENWSFDGLYGKFPGANNLANASNNQVDRDGHLLSSFPLPVVDSSFTRNGKKVDTATIDPNFRGVTLQAHPYDLSNYVNPGKATGDITHLFYTEQMQIDSGRMDKFVTYSKNPGLVQSYYDATQMPEGKWAQEYTLCDNFFHSAFGGSFLNHIWLIAARSPEWKDAPDTVRCKPGNANIKLSDNQVTQDGYVVNTSNSVNKPHPGWDKNLVPPQTFPTIGDRLIDAGISWAWYAGGWNDAIKAQNPNSLFMCHHQPFIYFESFKDGSANKDKYLKDELDFMAALKTDTLPAVSFIKGFGPDDEHPKYANLMQGQIHVDSLVKAIKASKYWDDAVIIITYDEHGGRWDHVAPPKIDKWGPGSRIPCIIISKFAKKKFIDHTQYETVSILKLIETRFGLSPLTSRDSAANNLLNAFEF